MESIHGHEVMHMIADSKQSFTSANLIAEINRKFGEAARFHTCSAENLTAAGLVDFLTSKGKFQGGGEPMSLDASTICNLKD